MSNAEVGQCIFDIKSWFARTDRNGKLGNQASSVDFQRLEKSIDMALPSTLKILLSELNGGIYFMDKKQLNTDEISSCIADLDKSSRWKSGLIPFCGDRDSLLVINVNRGEEIYEWDSEEGLGDQVAPSLTTFLEEYRNSILGGHFEYLEDIGVVEKVGATAKSRK